jgi:hypothetical protein
VMSHSGSAPKAIVQVETAYQFQGCQQLVSQDDQINQPRTDSCSHSLSVSPPPSGVVCTPSAPPCPPPCSGPQCPSHQGTHPGLTACTCARSEGHTRSVST